MGGLTALLLTSLTVLEFKQQVREPAPAAVSSTCRLQDKDLFGNTWHGTQQGVIKKSPDGKTSLYRYVPQYDFTCVKGVPDGTVWFGTKYGAFYYDGSFHYRAGKRWLPDNEVRDIAFDKDRVLITTATGANAIKTIPMTLSQKAAYFEMVTEARHNRLGYISDVGLRVPGDLSTFYQRPQDNDGLWTSMYAAAQSFRYAATGDEQARIAAKRSIDALILLEQVTGVPGLPARTILPGHLPDPDTPEELKLNRPLGKTINDRWIKSNDGKWWWKCDTSSDELDGHFFAFSIYYDLVADTEERTRVAAHVKRLADHLIDNDYTLIDHDGKPTQWGVFSPDKLNGPLLSRKGVNPWRLANGFRSLELLSYMKVAAHVTGEERYAKAYDELVTKHHYDENVRHQKYVKPFYLNHGDDQRIFMCFYTLMSYEKDLRLREKYSRVMERVWRLDRSQRNPLFNFIAVALEPKLAEGVADGVQTLKDAPLDLISWKAYNKDRKDLAEDHYHTGFQRMNWRERLDGGHQRRTSDGKPNGVISIDENTVLRWNANQFQTHKGRDGLQENEPTFWLLPYYLGLYHGLFGQK